MDKIKSLEIYGRRWFQKTYGNTYHSCTVYVNGEKLRNDFTYGYGDQYLTTAYDLLKNNKYISENTDYYTFSKFLYENKIIKECIDVERKRDL